MSSVLANCLNPLALWEPIFHVYRDRGSIRNHAQSFSRRIWSLPTSHVHSDWPGAFQQPSPPLDGQHCEYRDARPSVRPQSPSANMSNHTSRAQERAATHQDQEMHKYDLSCPMVNTRPSYTAHEFHILTANQQLLPTMALCTRLFRKRCLECRQHRRGRPSRKWLPTQSLSGPCPHSLCATRGPSP